MLNLKLELMIKTHTYHLKCESDSTKGIDTHSYYLICTLQTSWLTIKFTLTLAATLTSMTLIQYSNNNNNIPHLFPCYLTSQVSSQL